jgi:23S rRNA (cytosine1962-C5)-methyltransferase
MNDLPEPKLSLIRRALAARLSVLDETHSGGLRLFNGYYEGWPDLVVDLYGCTLLLSAPDTLRADLAALQALLLEELPWANCVVQKLRQAVDPAQRRGVVTFGAHPADQVVEHGVKYALDLIMNQDASFYLDTRFLRRWLLENAAGWRLLNTFAYTGSLGVAGLAGGAEKVVQLDRNRRFLELSQQSCRLNQLDEHKMDLQAVDFFPGVADLKRNGSLFDCVIADPPYFSSTAHGRVNLVDEGTRIINKLRPLVRDGGRLVIINNALFLSGAEHLRALEQLCVGGYLEIETFIPVPEDITGFDGTVVDKAPADPTPFNHSTKIAVLKVRRKNP